MATETQQAAPAPAAPELTIFSRVGSIPLVADSLNTINATLMSNTYTRSPYETATGLSKRALSYTEPLQKCFAPILVRADGLANKGLDAVESRLPYAFHTPTEDILKDLKANSDHAKDVATKTIDERVRTPAYNIAQGIDQVCASLGHDFNLRLDKPCLHVNADDPSFSGSLPLSITSPLP